MRAIPGRFVILAAVLESLYLILLTLGDLRQFLVEAILVQLLSGLFYLVCVYFLLQNGERDKLSRYKSLPHFVLLAAVVFRLTVWPLYPAFSDDVYRYRWEGKLQVHGGNPYQVRPNDPNWSHLRDGTFASVPLRDFKAGYGPLTELIERWTYRGVAARTSDPIRQTFWFKLPAAIFDLGILGALWLLASVRNIPRGRILIYAWCPVPVIEFWATGHNDSIAVFFVVLAVLLASRERWIGASSMLGIGVAAKLWPVLLFPAFMGWRGWRPIRWYQWVAAIPVAGVAALPYWSRVTENVQFMSGFVGGWRNNDSLYGALLWLTGDVYDAKYLSIAVICAVSLGVMWLRLPLEQAWLAVAGGMLLISANSHPWYLTWLLPALVFVPFQPFLLWIVLAPLAHHVIIDWAVLGEWRGSTPMRWLIYVPVYGWLVFSAVSSLLRAGAAADKQSRETSSMKSTTWVFWLPLLFAPFCLGQDPQMIWEGEVDGTSVLYFRGNRLDVKDKSGLPVQRQRFRFFDRLPDSRLNVELQVKEGRGRVRIVEQPRLENNYTLAVEIDDRQGGSSFYSLAFQWDTSRGGFAPDRVSPLGPVRGGLNGDSLTWSGRVDGEVVIVCRDRRCDPEVRAGQPVVRDRFRFSRPLPDRDVQVSLDETSGRGEVRLLQQPRRENDYTAQVLIQDHQGGSADYSFTLSWTQPRRGAPDSLFTRPGMYWSGRVDGKVRVIVEQRNAWSEVVAGGPVTGERIRFEQPLPQRGGSEPQVRKLRGRGRVEIVEFPSSRNGFRLVFEIEDDKGGSDNYEVEAGW